MWTAAVADAPGGKHLQLSLADVMLRVMTQAPESSPPAAPFRRVLSDLLAAQMRGRQAPAWLAGRLYRREIHVLQWMTGARRPTIADCYDLARILDADPASLAIAAGLPPPERVGLNSHPLADVICNWRAVAGLNLAQAATMLHTTPMTLARWEVGQLPHAAGRHRLIDVLGLDLGAMMRLDERPASPVPAEPPSRPRQPKAPKSISRYAYAPDVDRPPPADEGVQHPRAVTCRAELPAAVRAWRAAQQLSFAQAGQVVAAGATVVARWESGKTVPTSRHMRALAIELHCDPVALRDALYPPSAPAPFRRRAAPERPDDRPRLLEPGCWQAGDIAQVLECWLRVHDATRTALAGRMGLSGGGLTRWLQGEVRPDTRARRRLVALLQWPAEEVDRVVGVPVRPPAPEPVPRWPRAGALLQGRRRAVGLTRQQAGVAMGVPALRLERWESGLSRPQKSLRPVVARVLRLHPDALEHMLAADSSPDRRVYRIERLAELRRVRGLTQAQLAKAVGVSQRDISSWERRGVRARDLPALSRELRVDLRALLGPAGARPPEGVRT